MEGIVYILVIGGVAFLFVGALTGFILVQIKARPIWRLLSLAVVLVGSCWFCSYWTQESLNTQYSNTYVRGSVEYLDAIDKLSIQGRTNDIHQACQNFPMYFYLSTDTQSISNFDRFIADTEELAARQSNSVQAPTASSPTASTNK